VEPVLNRSHPFQDLFHFLRHPFLFADTLIGDSWMKASNWLLFKGIFVFVLIVTLRDFAGMPQTAQVFASGISTVFDELMRAMANQPQLSGSMPNDEAGILGFVFWVVLNILYFPMIFAPLMAVLKIVFFSSLVYLFVKAWGLEQEIKFSRILIFSAYAHWGVLLGFFLSNAIALMFIEFVVLFYLAKMLKNAVLAMKQPGAIPSTFAIWSGLLVIESILMFLGLSPA